MEDVKEAFTKNEIVPDVIDTPPGELITVMYSGSEMVTLGNKLTPTQVHGQPIVNWKADSNKFYTLCMIDPDAPSRKIHLLREVNHWLIGNIPGDDIEKGDLLIVYAGSGPPMGTGFHRYIFLVFEQQGKLTFDEPKSANSIRARAKFQIRKFADKYNLGQPIAGNFYYSGWENSCLIL